MSQQPAPQTDDEARELLTYRQPHGSQQYAVTAVNNYNLIRQCRKASVQDAYIGAIALTNAAFGFAPGGPSTESESESESDVAEDIVRGTVHDAELAEDHHLPVMYIDGSSCCIAGPVRRFNLVPLRAHLAAWTYKVMLTSELELRDPQIGRDLSPAEELAETAKAYADAMFNKMLEEK